MKSEKWQFMFEERDGEIIISGARHDEKRRLVDKNLPPHVLRYLGMNKDGSRKYELTREMLEKSDLKLRAWNTIEIKWNPDWYRETVDMKTLPEMSSHYDGAHWGITDWYPEIEGAIQAALNRSKRQPDYRWTTGWYSSKKEIVSARIDCHDGNLYAQVSVSDDFDTVGLGEGVMRLTTNLDALRDLLHAAWEDAESNQRDNRMYRGWSVYKNYRCVDYYIENTHGLDAPTGDNYHEFGFQNPLEIPPDIREALESFVLDVASFDSDTEFAFRGWKIKAWED